jgi:hypothetical protein
MTAELMLCRSEPAVLLCRLRREARMAAAVSVFYVLPTHDK